MKSILLIALLAASASAQRHGGMGSAPALGRGNFGASSLHRGFRGNSFRFGFTRSFAPAWRRGGFFAGYGGSYDYPYFPPTVMVVYLAPQTVTLYQEPRPIPVMHEYETPAPASSPIYLIAMSDGVIRAASSYNVEGATLHYVTLERYAKQVPLASIDRAFTLQLNRERHVPFQLPE